MGCSFQAKLIFLIIFFQEIITSTHGVTFYPYGHAAGDKTLQKQDDAFTTISINIDFPFFGKVFSAVQISTNGIIYFGEGSTSFTPSPFPLNGTKCVAAYWVDSNPQEGGEVFYREIFHSEILQQISDDIKSKFVKFNNFRSSWAIAVTFNNIPRYNCRISRYPCHKVVNHQTILTSNGIDSFVIFLYDKLGYDNAQIGFNAGDGKRYFLVPNSNTALIPAYALSESNVGEPGKWVFSISDEIFSVCSLRGVVEVHPKKVLYYGGEEIVMTGPCFNSNETQIKVKFANQTVECKVFDQFKISCICPYFDQTGKIQIQFFFNNVTFSNFIVAHDEQDDLIVSSQITAIEDEIKNPFNISWDVSARNTSQTILSGFERYVYINENGDVLDAVTQIIRKKIPNIGNYIFYPNGSIHTTMPETTTQIIRTYYLLVGQKVIRNVAVFKRLYSNEYFTCNAWYKKQHTNKEMLEIINTSSQKNPCQPTVPGSFPVQLPGGFVQDDSCNTREMASCNFFHPGARVCYRSTNNENVLAATQCCYDSNGRLIIGPPGGGAIIMVDSMVSKSRYFMNEILPYIMCCKFESTCNKYYEKRLSIDSKYYVPPRPIWTKGDPHFVTLDGTSYDFNPIGEFLYLQSNDVTVQARISQFVDKNNIAKQASYFSAFAIKARDSVAVQVELSPQKTIQVKIKNEIMPQSNLDMGDLYVDYQNESIIELQSIYGITLQVHALNGMLNMITLLQQNLKRKVYGLIGNWDDNPLNDFMLPDKSFISINSSKYDIHFKFGMNWSTTNNTSIFSYPEGLFWKDFQNPNFHPNFETPPSDPRCGEDKDCLFDLHVTGDIDLSLSNIIIKQVVKQIETANLEMSETCLTQIKTPNGIVTVHSNSSDYKYVIYTVECNKESQLFGNAVVHCDKGHLSGQIGSCFTSDGIPSSTGISFIAILLQCFFASLII